MEHGDDFESRMERARDVLGSGLQIRCLQILQLAMTGQLFHVTLTVGRSLIRRQVRPDFVNRLADRDGPAGFADLFREIPLRDDTVLDLAQVKAIYPVPFR
jgi:hypothetical protein